MPSNLIYGNLGRAHRVLNGKDDIIWNFDELAGEREICRTLRNGQRASARERSMNMLVT